MTAQATGERATSPGLALGDEFLPRDALLSRARRAASGLETLGVGPGTSVALILRNGFEFVEASLAVRLLGAYAVPINWHWSAGEVEVVLADCKPVVVIAEADLADRHRAALSACTTLRVGHSEGTDPNMEWTRFLSAHSTREGPPVSAPPSMIYTSGTTGKPKGVRRVPFTGAQADALRDHVDKNVLGIVPGIRTVIPAPLYHSAPNTYALTAAIRKGLVVLMPRFDPEELLRLVEVHRIDRLQLVPTHFSRLLALPDEVRQQYDVSSLRWVVHAAAPCPPEVKRRMIDWWGPIIHEFYGSTETGPITACDSEEWLRHPGTVGRPLRGATIRVLDSNRCDVPHGTPGEIFARLDDYGDFTYHEDPDKRASAEVDGLISVGDIGYLDNDGYLFLKDRKADVVISGGVNIYPAEIEAALSSLSGVRDSAVFGIPDEEFGEALAVLIEPEPGATLSEDEVRSYLSARIAGYKLPRVVEFRDSLPREDTGKILKRRLREPYWAGTGRSI